MPRENSLQSALQSRNIEGARQLRCSGGVINRRPLHKLVEEPEALLVVG